MIRLLFIIGLLTACTKSPSPSPSGPAPAPVNTPSVDNPPAPLAPVFPEPVPPAPIEPKGTSGLACAERVILLAAKKNVAAHFGNSPVSHGFCAMGVRSSLQASKVGGVTDALGSAIDFLRTLRPHGFVDTGDRDPRHVPPGSVLVFSGPRTPAYLKNGHFGRPAGDWLGHVTIKGDDGRYYTDGRTKEPAIGWSDGVNQAHRRNMAATFVPNSSLASQYDGKCAKLLPEEQAVDLALATAEVSVLPFEDATARDEGRALVREGLQILDRGSSPVAFSEALRLAREGVAFDEEGQLTQALADRLAADPSLQREVDQYRDSLGTARGVDACKTKVFFSSLERTLCLRNAHVDGQDANDVDCGKPLGWDSCLALER